MHQKLMAVQGELLNYAAMHETVSANGASKFASSLRQWCLPTSSLGRMTTTPYSHANQS